MGQQLITNYLPDDFDLQKITSVIPPNVNLIFHSNSTGYWLKSQDVLGDSTYAYCKDVLGPLIWEPDNTTSNANTTQNTNSWQPSWGKVTSPVGLNVRPNANTNQNPVGTLDQGQRFHIVSQNNGWYQIDMPFQGYIDAEYTQVSQTPQTVSDDLLAMTESWEGFSATPYQDCAGNWTIGYGICSYDTKPTCDITKAAAQEQLRTTLNQFAAQVYGVTQDLDLCQTEFDALVDFCYNLGFGAFEGSDLFANFKQCMANPIIIGDFTAWSYAGGVQVEGLVRRRNAEATLWLTGQYVNN